MKPASLNRLMSIDRDIDGLPLRNDEGESLGVVSAFLRDAENRARFAVVTPSRFRRSVAGKILVPDFVLQAQTGVPGYVLTTDETLLDDAPEFDTSQIGQIAYTRKVDAHYRA